MDRHLFGLKKLLKEGEPVPEIYTDEAFSKTNHWELSTSQLSSPFLDGWGYGEGAFLEFATLSLLTLMRAVVEDGYGLAYAIGDNYLRWTITSLKRDTEKLKNYLKEAADETLAMMQRAAAAEAPSNPKL